jgi:AcrR family transcriptional regulator
MTELEVKLRTDAQANRDRILGVARDALAADPAASLNSIAKAAGVGAGTLYRHFPSREALVLGVYRKEIEALVALAPALLAEHPPLAAFRLWCKRLAEYGRRKHGIRDVVRAAMTDRDFQETYWPMVDAVRQLMEACEHADEIRSDCDAEDFLQLLACMLDVAPTPEGQERADRLLALVFRGLGAADMPALDAIPEIK